MSKIKNRNKYIFMIFIYFSNVLFTKTSYDIYDLNNENKLHMCGPLPSVESHVINDGMLVLLNVKHYICQRIRQRIRII